MKTRRPLIMEPLEAKAPPSSGLLGSGLAEKLAVSLATAHPGQPVSLTATLTNVSHHDVTVADGPSRHGFAISRGGREVWRSDEGMMTAMFLTRTTLHPGESISTQATWDGQLAGGSATTGTFHVTSAFGPAGATFHVVPAHSKG